MKTLREINLSEDSMNSNLEVSPELSQRAYLNILEDMQNDKEEMENQRIATFNIMEDISEAQEMLKKRYTDLDTLKDLVQQLGSSLKMTVVMKQLTFALQRALSASVNVAYVILSSDPGKPSNIMYIHARFPIGKPYLDSIEKNITNSFDSLLTETPRTKKIEEWISGKFFFEFIKGTQNNDLLEPNSILTIPLVVDDILLGLVNVSSVERGLFLNEEKELINTMVSATANTISRLRQLLDSEQSRIQSLVESLSNGVIMFDLNQKVTMSNPIAQQMTGLPRDGFYITEFTKLFTDAAAAADKELLLAFEEKINETLQLGISTHIEEANISRFNYEVFITPVYDYKKKLLAGQLFYMILFT